MIGRVITGTETIDGSGVLQEVSTQQVIVTKVKLMASCFIGAIQFSNCAMRSA